MDWNWFFSSLSQSAAAIVGIFGAFIITKILSNQTTFLEKKNRLKELVASAEKIVDDSGALYFDWYNKQTTKIELGKIERLLEEGAKDNAEHLYNILDLSPFIERATGVAAIDEVLQERHERTLKEEEEMRRELEAAEKRRPLWGNPGAVGVMRPVPEPALRLIDPHLVLELNKERESIDRVIRDARHHVRVISDFLDSIRGNPEASPQITWALVLVTVLFYAGVIYPLSFMPLRTDATIELSISIFFQLLFSLKGLLLAAVSTIFTAILAMFFVMNARMRYSALESKRLMHFSDVGAYSTYFAILEANQKARVVRPQV